MMGEQGAQLLWAVGALVLVASSLIARRLPIRQMLKMALLWFAIFATIFIGFSMRQEIGRVWQRAKFAALGQAIDTESGTIRIAMSADGHFWTNAAVNGRNVRFLIDSGATFAAISNDTAERSGVPIDETGFPVLIQTANGAIHARRGRIERFAIGSIVRDDMAVTISSELGDTNLLGMNFLSTLKSWRVEGRTLVLER